MFKFLWLRFLLQLQRTTWMIGYLQQCIALWIVSTKLMSNKMTLSYLIHLLPLCTKNDFLHWVKIGQKLWKFKILRMISKILWRVYSVRVCSVNVLQSIGQKLLMIPITSRGARKFCCLKSVENSNCHAKTSWKLWLQLQKYLILATWITQFKNLKLVRLQYIRSQLTDCFKFSSKCYHSSFKF